MLLGPARTHLCLRVPALRTLLLLGRRPAPTGSSRGIAPLPHQQDRCSSTLQPSAAGGPRGGRRSDADRLASADAGGPAQDALDIEALLADEGAMAALRSKLQAEMAEAHGRAGSSSAGAAPGGGSSGSRGGSTPGGSSASNRRNSRAFDSDDYTDSALSTVADAAGGSVDEMAQDAADRLAHDSADIAQLITHEHAHDHMLQSASSSSGKQSSSKGSEARGASFAGSLKLPSFAGGGQQQQQRGGRGGARTAARNDSRNDSRSSRRARDPSSGSGGSSSSDSGRGGARPLQGDTTIGRVAEAKGGVPVAVLKQGKARLFESGSPMVYGGAVDYVMGRPPPVAGDVVVVADHTLRPIAWGVFNLHSMFRVRILQTEVEALAADDELVLDVGRLLEMRLKQAVALRACLSLPSGSTTAYRVVNSEGDRLSGLVADVMGEVLVVQSCAAWTERYREVITSLLPSLTGCSRVVWRPATSILREEGIEPPPTTSSSTSSTSSSEEAADEGAAAAAAGDSSSSWLQQAVKVQEGGLTFFATPEEGQKTGFYADQRANRALIASLARGKTVLDLCCYSGGFALAAAAAGAAAALGVDSSASAVELAQANAELNGVADRCAFVRDDVSVFLRAALEAGQSWEVVVLDPPKLAPNRGSLPRATGKYRRLNELALGVVKSGGLLITCSCSGAMTQSNGLPRVVQEAAAAAERQVTLLCKSGAAPDHPLHPAYPEGEYLTALTYRVV